MATPTDLERPSAQRRGPAGSRIAVAGDRGADAKSARRHSSKVRLLKGLLPLAALAVVAGYAGAVLKTSGWGGAVPNVSLPKILPEHLAIKDPVYEGFDEDGGRYVVRSETAQQDLTNRNRITLVGITGELIDANKSKTNLKAARGTFEGRANQLELFDGIEVDAESGLSARLATALVRTKEHIIQSQDPVSVTMPSGTVTASEMTLRQKLREITFVRDVVAHFRPAPAEADAAKVAAAAKPAAFGASNEPIDITANRLDVADATKLAVFSGDVTAAQGAAKLTTPELRVAFEPAPESAKGVAGAPSMGKVQRVLATKPVSITQATGERVTSDAAEFDTVAQTALLTGGVTVQAAADRKAIGDRAELDQRTDTVVLTGAVVVTQGRNELKGRRLVHERASGRTMLSSPAEPRGAAGRITARFYQREGTAAAAKPANTNGDGEAAGGLFGAGFKTDPNAPVDIDAETLEVNDATKIAVFRGEVRAVQGDTVIRTPEMTAHYAGEAGLGTARGAGERPPGPAAQLTRIEARRKVVVTAKDGQTATGDWADFDVKANTVTLGGEVLLSHGQNTVNGTRLVINMNTGESVLKADPKAGWAANALPKAVANGAASLQGPSASGRPSAVFYPKQLKEAGKRELPADTSQPRPSGGATTRSN